MKKSYTNKDALLGLILIILIIGIIIVKDNATLKQDPLYDIKIQAYEYMEEYMRNVRDFKAELGLELSQEDIHDTGMLGQSFSPITTSLGNIEAKRTSANPNMAALVVELLHKAGIKSGDRIGASFSGSFPSLNLAVIAASKAMDIECYYISSIGSSNYGANDPELTFPDMAIRLYDKGIIDSPGVAFSIGGSGDMGNGLDEEVVGDIVERLEYGGLKQIVTSNYHDNLKVRQKLYEDNGSISCFINVGGNITSLGQGEDSIYFGQGLLTGKLIPVSERSGLIEIYRNKGIPVIHLLNLRKLTSDYGIPYDPIVLPDKGELSLYMKPSFNSLISIIFIVFACVGLFRYKNKE